jgi:hypothetical protein
VVAEDGLYNYQQVQAEEMAVQVEVAVITHQIQEDQAEELAHQDKDLLVVQEPIQVHHFYPQDHKLDSEAEAVEQEQ